MYGRGGEVRRVVVYLVHVFILKESTHELIHSLATISTGPILLPKNNPNICIPVGSVNLVGTHHSGKFTCGLVMDIITSTRAVYNLLGVTFTTGHDLWDGPATVFFLSLEPEIGHGGDIGEHITHGRIVRRGGGVQGETSGGDCWLEF